jgi:hypothetical protein
MRYQLTLQPLPDPLDPAGIKRLRSGLKHLLRSCRLKCVSAIEIVEDGRTLRGSEWVTPEDYQTDDVEAGLLPCLKGSTPIELPSLDDEVPT